MEIDAWSNAARIDAASGDTDDNSDPATCPGVARTTASVSITAPSASTTRARSPAPGPRPVATDGLDPADRDPIGSTATTVPIRRSTPGMRASTASTILAIPPIGVAKIGSAGGLVSIRSWR